MKSKAIFMALLALAFGAQAVSVDVENAKLAARAWAYRGATLGARIGDTVEDAATHRTANDVTFYAIKMKGGGTVFMSSDTEDTPVILFTQEPGDFANIDKASPLWALLNRDAAVRQALRAKQAVKRASAAAGGAANVTLSANEKLWDELVSFGTAMADPSIKLPSRTHVANPGDVRVSPLVKSKWDQSTVGTKNVYNYFTPKLSVRAGFGDGGQNAVCGCVATAMSQVMRYHQFPSGFIAPVTRECTVEAMEIRTTAANRNLTMQGGVYDWANMPLVPTLSISDDECKAIGKLTSDAGISVYMNYDYAVGTGAGGSGSFMPNAAEALRTVFGFKSAVYYTVPEKHDITEDPTFVKLAMLSNFDAGYPVLMGISGAGGHAIVGDGYGFSSDNLYVHLNMGWSGSQDTWYNLPDIDAGYYHFTVFDDVVFNIFPDSTGATMSGLALDNNGNRMDKVTVIAYKDGSEVARTIANKGVWGMKLPSGTYNLEAMSEDGSLRGEITSIEVKAATTSTYNFNGIITDISWTKPYSAQRLTSFENVWGAEITLEEVVYENSVQNERTSVKYGTLDQAIEGAMANDTLLILSTTLLRNPQTIDKSITIRTADGVLPEDAPVHCRAAAAHGFTNVLNGATLTLENVVFANTQGCFVDVARGGKLQVGGVVGLTDADKTGGSFVRTVDGTGFVLAGVLTSYLQIKCIEAGGLNNVFGSTTLSAVAAQGCVKYLLNPDDDELAGGVNTETLALFWNRVEPEPDRAVAYFTADGGESKTYYTKLSTAINDNNVDGDIYLLKDACTLTTNAWANGRKRILCTNEIATVVTYANRHALISVNPLGSLVVSNVTFTGASHQGAFVVNGGELTLDADTLIVECTNTVGRYIYSEDFLTTPQGGAVTVRAFNDWVTYNPGKLTMLAGSVISNCTTTGYGGGVYVGGGLNDSGACSFDLFGGKIVNCSAENFGGGAYVGYDSTINVKGEATVTGNKIAGESVSNNNVDLSEGGSIVLADELTGRINVHACEVDWLFPGYGNQDTNFFGTVAEACDETTATNSAYNFRCDVRSAENNKELRGEYVLDENGNRMLAWSELPVPVQDVEPEYPVAWVIYDQEDGSTLTNKYGTLDEALASITADATVEIADSLVLPQDGPGSYSYSQEQFDMLTSLVARLTKSVDIEHNVLLRTTPGEKPCTNTIWQSDQGRVTVANGGKLTLENVTFRGTNPAISDVNAKTNESGAVEEISFKYGMESGGTSGVLEVNGEGSELILSVGTTVRDFTGSASRAAAAICAEGGTVRLQDGAEVGWCINSFRKDDGQPENNPAPAGGILVNDGLLSLEGGSVHDCGAIVGGGVLAENGSRVEVSGSPRITDNYLLVGSKMPTDSSAQTNANLSVANDAVDSVAQLSELALVGEFTGDIGMLEPRLYGKFDGDAEINTNVFGKVETDTFIGSMVPSAAKFTRDASGATGLIVTNDTEALLVWTSAVKDGVYRDKDGKEYKVVEDTPVPPPAPTEIDPPTAVTGLIYNGNEQTGVVVSVGFTLTGNIGTNAGPYTAVATPAEGYCWTGGLTAATNVEWSIAKATYDMSGVVFTNVTYVCDGTAKSNLVDETTLPVGVSVTNYLNNGQTEVNVYTVTAQFGGDEVNYEPIADMTATLTIIENPTPDPPDPPEPPAWDVVTNHPGPIAFKSIDRVNDTEWKLTITNRVEYCNYRLLWTTDLTKGFTSTGAWEHAVGPAAEPVWTTNVIMTGGAWFWRAEGADGTNMVPRQAEGK